MTKRKRSPQEKKILSYQKDCRNDYGENDKASRKTIPLRKAMESRATRRMENQKLKAGEVDALDGHGKARTAPNTGWRKIADRPLGEIVERQKTTGRKLFPVEEGPHGHNSLQKEAQKRNQKRR